VITCTFLLGIFLVQLNQYLKPKELLVASGTLSIQKMQNATKSFNYEGSQVSTSMDVECNIPATISLNVLRVDSEGAVFLYINDFNYASGTISVVGIVELTSGCGCSTVCICEIQAGENSLKIVSQGFEGEIKYEIYVKS
jgi:hypothetical protein